MINLLQIILDDIKYVPDLIEAWRAIGVSGTTIMKSVGGYRTSTWLSKVGLSAIDHLFEAKEIQRKTILAIIEGEELLARAIAEAERIVGGFDRPNSGVLIVLPISLAKGLYKAEAKEAQQPSPPALRQGWQKLRDTPIEEVDAIMRLEPTLVKAEDSLNEVAQSMLAHPDVHVACVVADDGRLLGLLSLRNLADDLFFHILPEEFLAESTDLETMMDFADKSRIVSAGDAMVEPAWVKPSDTVKVAFQRMHDLGLPGLPVVDDLYRVTGYINQLELVALCMENKGCTESAEEIQ